ncbi:MAG: hypothetical protein K1X75_03930 [Leptospirales bacterium]|nr:hypothetical protein [Leptospirales bacterium]
MPGSKFRLRLQFSIFLLLLFSPAGLLAEDRNSSDVFKKWLSWQRRFRDVNLSELVHPDRSYAVRVVGGMPDALTPQLSFLGAPVATRQVHEADLDKIVVNLQSIYRELDSDMPAFVARLREHHFGSVEINRQEEMGQRNGITELYRNLFETLFDLDTSLAEDEALLAVANRLYEYAFGAATFRQFKQCMDRAEQRPIARLFYANMWYNLSGTGWRFWNQSALDAMRDDTAAGREIVYIAGGTDIYQMIQSGIYRIRNIDPIFPSQTKYYSEGWEFLISGEGPGHGIGDRIMFENASMVRESYVENGSFQTPQLSNDQRATIPRSTTTWRILSRSGEAIGYYVLERRFATQQDFEVQPNQRLLISFNELAYIADPGPRGWGIDVSAFPSNFSIYVKQLRRPVNRQMLVNMRAAEESAFSYIRLGTSIN